MTSVLPSFDISRPQSHNSLHQSPGASPQIQRSSSQASFHLNGNNGNGHYSPSPVPEAHYPSIHTQPYRSYQPHNISLPSPQFLGANHPNTAPPFAFYPGPPTYDSRIGSHPMIRTISHAHPMHSATDHTASPRYSSSPHSPHGLLPEAPHTAAGTQPGYIHGPPAFNFEAPNQSVNPQLFNNYPMSRSTSGASENANDAQRLLTPHYEYKEALSPSEHELRKVSDSLGRAGLPTAAFYPNSVTTSGYASTFDTQAHGQILGLGPHPQPMFNAGHGQRFWSNDFAMGRGDSKAMVQMAIETDYERERAQQIMNNKKLLEDVGLGGMTGSYARRNAGGMSHERSRKASTPAKKRITSAEAPIRASPRIASTNRAVSYANLDGGSPQDSDIEEEEYPSEPDVEIEEDDEEDFRPAKRTKGGARGGRKPSYVNTGRIVRKTELSLWGLLEVYPEIPHLFPLFYYTLNNDLTINSDSVPLIGSIPSTVTPIEKTETLRTYFHRGRRVLYQLDAFSSRCDRKYDGPEEKWAELEYHTRIAIRDVRRKVVERCENYKYTRRDILDKIIGKNKWQPIEHGMIEWRSGMTQNDPAGDLSNVTLTLPTPPPSVYAAQQRSASSAYSQSNRAVKPLPRSRMPSSATSMNRVMSVTMAEPGAFNQGMMSAPPQYVFHQQPTTPMHGEDEVPMNVQLSVGAMPGSAAALAPVAETWEGTGKGSKRARSEEEKHGDEEEE